MKYLFIILLTLAINAQAGKKTYCGPDSVICRYESAYTQLEQISKFAAGNKSIIWALLYDYTDGAYFGHMTKYVNSMGTSTVDGTLVFLDPTNKVVSTKILLDTPSKKVVKRVLSEERLVLIDDKETVSNIVLIYTVSNDSGKWKINNLVPGTI